MSSAITWKWCDNRPILLLGLLNDILDFSKIEAGKLELEAIDFGLRDCVGKTGKTLSVRAADKNLELACRIHPDLPDTLVGDPGRLRQVLVNLAGNAIKFTDRGEVVIDVNEERRSDGEIHLRFSVKDTGIGIAPDKQKKVFEAFAQEDASTTRRFGGTGLGLAICSKLVTMMRGRIWLESELGEGTTFNFTARFGIGKKQPRREATLATLLRECPTVIVDDNQTNRRILEEVLRPRKMPRKHFVRARSATLWRLEVPMTGSGIGISPRARSTSLRVGRTSWAARRGRF